MPIPAVPELEVPLLLELFRAGRSLEAGETYRPIRQHLPPGFMDDSDMNQTQPEGGNRYENLVQNAKENLKRKGAIESPERGIWRITSTGETLLRQLLRDKHRVSTTDLASVMSGGLRLSDIDQSWRPKPFTPRIRTKRRPTRR